MLQKHPETSSNKMKLPNKAEEVQSVFKDRIIRLSAIACELSRNVDDADIAESEQKSQAGLTALRAEGGIQEMLAAQMLSVHQLQQVSMAMIHKAPDMNTKQYFTNAAIKLANTFAQQANLFTRLQGYGGQKIIVEHVDVHQGGQAIVGNINATSPTGS